ncbi:hypothetical protein ACHQM5_009370 [Ranunculus cassubicifolius]
MSEFRRRLVVLLIAFLCCFISISIKAETMVRDGTIVDTPLSAETRTRNEPFLHQEDDSGTGIDVTVMDYTPVQSKKHIHN